MWDTLTVSDETFENFYYGNNLCQNTNYTRKMKQSLDKRA